MDNAPILEKSAADLICYRHA